MLKKRYIFCLAFMLSALIATAQEVDPVIKFYSSRANAIFESRNPILRGSQFSYSAKSFYKKMDGSGKVEKLDSLIADYFVSFGQLDSVIEKSRSSEIVPQLEYQIPNIFTEPYMFNLFPNDSGGTDLAIGFDVDSANIELPVGIAIIDRADFHCKWLYLHYPSKETFRRYSVTYRLSMTDGFLFPDSITVVATREEIFTTDSYRLETSIYDLEVQQ